MSHDRVEGVGPGTASAQSVRQAVRQVRAFPLQRRAIISLILSAATGLPALISKIQAIPGMHFPTWVSNLLAVVGVVALWAAPFLNSFASAGVQDNLEQHLSECPGGDNS